MKIRLILLFLVINFSLIFSQIKPESDPLLFLSSNNALFDNQSTTISIGAGNGTYTVGVKAYNNWNLAVNSNINLGKSFYFDAGFDVYEGDSYQKITMLYIGPLYKHLIYEKIRNAVTLKLGALGVAIGRGTDLPTFAGDILLAPSYDYWITSNITINAEIRSHLIIHQRINYIVNPVVNLTLHL